VIWWVSWFSRGRGWWNDGRVPGVGRQAWLLLLKVAGLDSSTPPQGARVTLDVGGPVATNHPSLQLIPVQIPFPQLLTPSKAPPSFLLFLSFLTHSFTFQTIGVPDTQESGASGGFMAGLTKVGSHQGWADSHGSRVHKYAICKAAYLMHR